MASEEDIAHAVIATQDGGFAVLGNTKSVDGDIEDKSNEVSDLILIKFNSLGEREWSKTYGGSEDDRGHSLVQLTDGSYAFAGLFNEWTLMPENEGQHDNWVIRVDATGHHFMGKEVFGFSGHDHAYNIIATKDGGLLFNGFLDVTSSEGARSFFQSSNE